MKTIKQYLQELPDPVIRDQALSNLYKEYADEWIESRALALGRAFLWWRSPEGYAYWKKVFETLQLKP